MLSTDTISVVRVIGGASTPSGGNDGASASSVRRAWVPTNRRFPRFSARCTVSGSSTRVSPLRIVNSVGADSVRLRPLRSITTMSPRSSVYTAVPASTRIITTPGCTWVGTFVPGSAVTRTIDSRCPGALMGRVDPNDATRRPGGGATVVVGVGAPPVVAVVRADEGPAGTGDAMDAGAVVAGVGLLVWAAASGAPAPTASAATRASSDPARVARRRADITRLLRWTRSVSRTRRTRAVGRGRATDPTRRTRRTRRTRSTRRRRRHGGPGARRRPR